MNLHEPSTRILSLLHESLRSFYGPRRQERPPPDTQVSVSYRGTSRRFLMSEVPLYAFRTFSTFSNRHEPSTRIYSLLHESPRAFYGPRRQERPPPEKQGSYASRTFSTLSNLHEPSTRISNLHEPSTRISSLLHESPRAFHVRNARAPTSMASRPSFSSSTFRASQNTHERSRTLGCGKCKTIYDAG